MQDGLSTLLREGQARSYPSTPSFMTRVVPKLRAWKGELDRMLSRNESRPARERLTLIRIFEELRGLG